MSDTCDNFATPRVAAGALFFDDKGRVLLVHPTYKDTSDVPGGYVERLRLLSVDWAPNEREGDKLLFLFDCGGLGEDEARIRLNREELDQWDWIDLDQLDRYVLDRIARRIRSTIARAGAYLEHGLVTTAT